MLTNNTSSSKEKMENENRVEDLKTVLGSLTKKAQEKRMNQKVSYY